MTFAYVIDGELVQNRQKSALRQYHSGWRRQSPCSPPVFGPWMSNNRLLPNHLYEVRPRKDRRGFDLISDALPFGRLWYAEPDAVRNAIGYAKFYSRSHRAVIRVFNADGKMVETHEHEGEFQEP